MNKKIANELAIGIILILTVIVGGIFWMQNKNQVPVETVVPVVQKPVAQPTTQTQTQPALPSQAQPTQLTQNSTAINTEQNPTIITKDQVASKIANWKLYTNDAYSYKINYPKNWFVDSNFAITPGSDYIGGDIVLSNYKNANSFNPGTIPKDFQSVFLWIFKWDSNKSLDDYINSKNFASHKEENILVNGVQGKRFIFDGKDDGNPNVEHIFLIKNGSIFDFSNGDTNTSGLKNILETIVATFKFTK